MDRREELKKELINLKNEEILMIRSYSKKREEIYRELRELDQQEMTDTEDESPKTKASKKNQEMYDVVLKIVKEHPNGIYSKELRGILKNKYHFQPSNMSLFMNNCRLKYPEIKKPRTGFFVYRVEN